MLVRVENISKAYRNSIGSVNREVLRDLSLELKPGDKIGIMGPSGSGKTTLLNMLGSLDVPDQGNITIDGKPLSTLKTVEILALRNTRIGFIFQFHLLLPQCTLLENVLLPTLPHQGNKRAVSQRAEELLKFMDIWSQRHNKPGELSGGECQRAAVARALINQPGIILADEPTGSLDTANAETLMELLCNINQQTGVTLVIATHSAQVAKKMDKIFRLENGQLENVII